MLINDVLNAIQFVPAKTTAILQSYWLQPEFRDIPVSLDVHVGRFRTITRVEEKPIWTNAQNCGHIIALQTRFVLSIELSLLSNLFSF
jgi:hypothetical protein